MLCQDCPNACNVDRTTQKGFCLAPEDMIINRIALHYYEEPPISGTRGSGAVFFGGCTMKCAFCQNTDISVIPHGKAYSPKQLAEELKRLEGEGAHNINFVTPTHYVRKIKETLDIYRPSIPILYNTSGYETIQTIESLKGYIDIYLPDYKYSDDTLGTRLSHRKNYPAIALSAITAMRNQVADTYDSNGLMKSGVIIRHLVLPGYVQNSLGVVRSVAKNFPTTTLSLMSQFTPMPACKDPNRPLKPLEYRIVVNEADKLLYADVFCQELTSCSTDFIPKWEF